MEPHIPPPPPSAPARGSRRPGCMVMLAAPVVGFLPMILWLLGSALKGGLQNETTTIGTLPWLMILTMPAGFVVFIVGTVLALNPRKRS